MSDTKVKISQLPAVSEVLGTDESPSVQSSTTKKFSMTQLGTYILSSFSGLSLGGITRTVKTAIDAISTFLGNSTMGTTATTVTGAIAEHESDITSLNSHFNQTLLSSTTMQAHSTSGTWAEYSVSNIKNYYLVGLVCSVDNIIQMIWIPYGNNSNWYIVETWDSTHRIRGGFSVDWANEKVKVRYLDAIGLTYTGVSVSKVYGFIRR